jgi:hypothetical protein
VAGDWPNFGRSALNFLSQVMPGGISTSICCYFELLETALVRWSRPYYLAQIHDLGSSSQRQSLGNFPSANMVPSREPTVVIRIVPRSRQRSGPRHSPFVVVMAPAVERSAGISRDQVGAPPCHARKIGNQRFSNSLGFLSVFGVTV